MEKYGVQKREMSREVRRIVFSRPEAIQIMEQKEEIADKSQQGPVSSSIAQKSIRIASYPPQLAPLQTVQYGLSLDLNRPPPSLPALQ